MSLYRAALQLVSTGRKADRIALLYLTNDVADIYRLSLSRGRESYFPAGVLSGFGDACSPSRAHAMTASASSAAA